jgi:hypothetical protein
MTDQPADPEYLTHREAAALLRSTPAALHVRNHEGKGPPRLKVGKRLLYPRVELLAWIESHRVTRPAHH